MPMVLALAGGSLIFVVFLVVLFFAIAYGYYTKAGSGISQRPSDGRGQAPGADGASSITTTEGDGDECAIVGHVNSLWADRVREAGSSEPPPDILRLAIEASNACRCARPAFAAATDDIRRHPGGG